MKMQKFISILTFVLIAGLVFLFISCVEEPTAPELKDQDSPNTVPALYNITIGIPDSIVVMVGNTFTIALESNPSTGYSWQAEFKPEYLKLNKEDFITNQNLNLVGAGGIEKKEFLALKPGDVELTMTYKRPWENEFQERHVIPVKITPKN
jgi:inhibitor of cysteine peptidase